MKVKPMRIDKKLFKDVNIKMESEEHVVENQSVIIATFPEAVTYTIEGLADNFPRFQWIKAGCQFMKVVWNEEINS